MTYPIVLLACPETTSVLSHPFRKSAERTGHGMLVVQLKFRAPSLRLFSGAWVGVAKFGESERGHTAEGRL